MVVDIASMQPAQEFDSRMEAPEAQTKANPTAPGTPEIFVPGEIEQRNAERNATGLALPVKTWEDLSALAAAADTAMPTPITAPADTAPDTHTQER